VFLRADKLVINNQDFTVETLYRLPEDLKYTALSQAQDGALLFYGYTSPFSSFYPSSFTIDGIRFNCAEQFFYFKKAEHFKDREAAVHILAATDPWAQKVIGKNIGDKDSDWSTTDHAALAMQLAIRAKFLQIRYLADVLRATDHLILAEASAHDKTWGTGIGIGSPGCYDSHKWPGKNGLGGLLMGLREELRVK
jgi:ribA/ribD-fused uncharacterized protein